MPQTYYLPHEQNKQTNFMPRLGGGCERVQPFGYHAMQIARDFAPHQVPTILSHPETHISAKSVTQDVVPILVY
jgi:hypothetical protein